MPSKQRSRRLKNLAAKMGTRFGGRCGRLATLLLLVGASSFSSLALAEEGDRPSGTPSFESPEDLTTVEELREAARRRTIEGRAQEPGRHLVSCDREGLTRGPVSQVSDGPTPKRGAPGYVFENEVLFAAFSPSGKSILRDDSGTFARVTWKEAEGCAATEMLRATTLHGQITEATGYVVDVRSSPHQWVTGCGNHVEVPIVGGTFQMDAVSLPCRVRVTRQNGWAETYGSVIEVNPQRHSSKSPIKVDAPPFPTEWKGPPKDAESAYQDALDELSAARQDQERELASQGPE